MNCHSYEYIIIYLIYVKPLFKNKGPGAAAPGPSSLQEIIQLKYTSSDSGASIASMLNTRKTGPTPW